jgi:hypothetical protein
MLTFFVLVFTTFSNALIEIVNYDLVHRHEIFDLICLECGQLNTIKVSF